MSTRGPCKYFLAGTCRNGTSCSWSHDVEGFDEGELGYEPGYEQSFEQPVFEQSFASVSLEVGGGGGGVSGGGGAGQVPASSRADAAGQMPGQPSAEQPSQRAFAVDCEFIQVRQGKGPDAREFSVTVSVGIVSEMLETILYARVRMPARCQLWDDSFARTIGNLEPDWNMGIRVDIACALVREFVDDGHILVGWQIEQDLKGLKLEDILTGKREQIVDLSEEFKTTQGNKCQLSEAYREIFGRAGTAHDACGDARMTMELYNWWQAHNMQPTSLRLCWYYVKWHSWRPTARFAASFVSNVDGGGNIEEYEAFRWKVLRPERSDRSTCIEELDDPRRREYVLKFRTDSERVAYFNLVKRRLCALHHCEAPTSRTLDTLTRCEYPSVTGDQYNLFR